jgi:hypothetical protein
VATLGLVVALWPACASRCDHPWPVGLVVAVGVALLWLAFLAAVEVIEQGSSVHYGQLLTIAKRVSKKTRWGSRYGSIGFCSTALLLNNSVVEQIRGLKKLLPKRKQWPE